MLTASVTIRLNVACRIEQELFVLFRVTAVFNCEPFTAVTRAFMFVFVSSALQAQFINAIEQ